MTENLPSITRLIGAVAAAAAAGASPTILLGIVVLIAFPVGFVIALAHALLLGLPAYLLLRRRSTFGWGIAAVVGFVIGAVPTGLLTLSAAGFANGGIWAPAVAGLCGTLGALAFRAVTGGASSAPTFDPAIWE